jgi:hypothetical protein
MRRAVLFWAVFLILFFYGPDQLAKDMQEIFLLFYYGQLAGQRLDLERLSQVVTIVAGFLGIWYIGGPPSPPPPRNGGSQERPS